MKAPPVVSRLRERHRLSHVPRKPTPIFVSPLDEERTNASIRHQQDQDQAPADELESKSNSRNDLSRGTTRSSNAVSEWTSGHHRTIYFKKRHESTAMELFYDLLFVANLTVFTDQHQILSLDGEYSSHSRTLSDH